MKKSKLKLKAYPQSVSEWINLWQQFPAFAAGRVSGRLVEDGVKKNESFGTGWNFLRNARQGDSITDMVYAVDVFGVYHDGMFVDTDYTCTRVAVEVIYDCQLVNRTLHYETRSQTLIVNEDGEPTYFKHKNGHMRELDVTSTAPIITFGGVEYVWLNQSDCEAGKAYTMKLVEKDLSERAVIFSVRSIQDLAAGIVRNDFKDAKNLHRQYLDIATRGLTEEEKPLLVTVKMSNANNYDTTKPIFTLKQKLLLRKLKTRQ